MLLLYADLKLFVLSLLTFCLVLYSSNGARYGFLICSILLGVDFHPAGFTD